MTGDLVVRHFSLYDNDCSMGKEVILFLVV